MTKRIKFTMTLSLVLNICLVIYHGQHLMSIDDIIEPEQSKVISLLFSSDIIASNCAKRMLQSDDPDALRNGVLQIFKSSDAEVFSMIVSSDVNVMNPMGRNNYVAFKIEAGPFADSLYRMSKWVPWRSLVLGNYMMQEMRKSSVRD